MNELAKLDKFGLTPAVNADFAKGVRRAVEMLADSLNTYGKQPTAALTDAWILKLHEKRIKAGEVGAAVSHFLDGRDMPTVGEFIAWILNNREDRRQLSALNEGALLHAEADEQRRLAKNLRLFGTEEPSIEQWQSHLAATGAADVLDSITGRPKARALGNVIELDETKMAHIRAQIESVRGG